MGDILYDSVACRGSEDSLSDCPRDDENDCTHAEDVGLECFGRLFKFDHLHNLFQLLVFVD